MATTKSWKLELPSTPQILTGTANLKCSTVCEEPETKVLCSSRELNRSPSHTPNESHNLSDSATVAPNRVNIEHKWHYQPHAFVTVTASSVNRHDYEVNKQILSL